MHAEGDHGLIAMLVGFDRQLGDLLGGDQPAFSAATRELLGWEPSGPTLIEDLEAGYCTS
ncbi:hypothetical protein [Streptomyces sp. NRRL WC-3626]|uniref:hypothetical protein n=1 Tax=Streptomyces sp. NRRL WC-3626 TaxID=1463926 RepID=UPI0004BF0830|nr:hypothetical protein [Streptomyces sp. NRRL WC-3626]